MKALALFSGGLDSALAIKIIKDQGIEVIALNFVSHFFGGKNEKAENMAKQLGVQLEYVNFSSVHTEILKDPVHGRGKNMNPCIDCHALMFKTAGDLMEKYGASFIISGEVLGQRPMSQNYQALEKVKALSPGLENLIVRPLSAKLLPESEPEKLGWIDRSKLLDIQGRSRKTQMELMDKFGIVDYPTPGGGCLLTDPAYSKRLRILEEDGLLEDENSNLFHLLKIGRFFRFEKGKYLIVGREQEDNLKINEFKDYGSLFIRGKEIPGPHMVGFGDLTQDEIDFALDLFSRYSKVKGTTEITLLLNG
ncbi:7-cyano-7-deazaguanine synthase, partial [Cetobacterium sp.]|uniref:7-cyano-7-deazaguanine synthase n=1 Tax=Cetobacterium sp. TaxID=2071632 RepID=UPI003F365C09